MTNLKECTFNCLWDGETLISSIARIDLATGRIFDVERVEGIDEDGREVETLDREYIDFEGIDGEFEVFEFHGHGYIACDIAEIQIAVAAASGTQP